VCQYDECRDLFIVILNGIMLSVVMLNVVMLNVVMMNVIAPMKIALSCSVMYFLLVFSWQKCNNSKIINTHFSIVISINIVC